jgi:mRNA-degrading endonuclease RelE of RelBE toxin-antitoxin system
LSSKYGLKIVQTVPKRWQKLMDKFRKLLLDTVHMLRLQMLNQVYVMAHENQMDEIQVYSITVVLCQHLSGEA